MEVGDALRELPHVALELRLLLHHLVLELVAIGRQRRLALLLLALELLRPRDALPPRGELGGVDRPLLLLEHLVHRHLVRVRLRVKVRVRGSGLGLGSG